MFYTTYGKFSNTIQNRHHGITFGIMSSDLLTFLKSKKCHTDRLILRQSFAHHLSRHVLYFTCKIYYFFVFDVFDIWHVIVSFSLIILFLPLNPI